VHMCATLCDVGFVSGLMHGLVAIICVILDAFVNVEVYVRCQDSWWYDFGFLIGVGASSGSGYLLEETAIVLLRIVAGIGMLLLAGDGLLIGATALLQII